MADEQRRALADRQLQLVRALTGGNSPAGFDQARLALTARTLLNKRSRAVARAWPRLAESLGDQFPKWFGQYAAEHPLPASGGSVADGLQFVLFLQSRDSLPDAGKLEWLSYRVHRKWMGFALLQNPPGIAVAVRLPWPLSRVVYVSFPRRPV
jgi:hypothetical protein